MQGIAQFALAASIVASVMGALVMSVLVFRYGFTAPAPSDAGAGPTSTDVLVTRVGHAVTAYVRAALTRAEKTVARGLGSDPLGRVSARD